MTFFFLVVLLALILSSIEGFTTRQPIAHQCTSRDTAVKLSAWTMSSATEAFDSFTSTQPWHYDQVDNPTTKRKVYEDFPEEFRFTLGNDWPSAAEETNNIRQVIAATASHARVNPIKRAVRWISKRRAADTFR